MANSHALKACFLTSRRSRCFFTFFPPLSGSNRLYPYFFSPRLSGSLEVSSSFSVEEPKFPGTDMDTACRSIPWISLCWHTITFSAYYMPFFTLINRNHAPDPDESPTTYAITPALFEHAHGITLGLYVTVPALVSLAAGTFPVSGTVEIVMEASAS